MHQQKIESAFDIDISDVHHLSSALRLSPYLPTRRLGGIKLRRLKDQEKKEQIVSRFKGTYIDSGAVDFSDKLRTSRRKGLTKLEFSERSIGFRNDINAPHRLHSGLDWRT